MLESLVYWKTYIRKSTNIYFSLEEKKIEYKILPCKTESKSLKLDTYIYYLYGLLLLTTLFILSSTIVWSVILSSLNVMIKSESSIKRQSKNLE